MLAEIESRYDREQRRSTILLVDDDQSQVAALEHRLVKLGFEVKTAFTGEGGLRRAFEELPDLVLLDLRLPDIHGFDVCRRLADDPQTCCIPVIILSAMERPDIVRRSRAMGCEYYLRKPYDPNVLLALIHNALYRPVLEDQA
jgi:DNA-binding response OmpR family regulator